MPDTQEPYRNGGIETRLNVATLTEKIRGIEQTLQRIESGLTAFINKTDADNKELNERVSDLSERLATAETTIKWLRYLALPAGVGSALWELIQIALKK